MCVGRIGWFWAWILIPQIKLYAIENKKSNLGDYNLIFDQKIKSRLLILSSEKNSWNLWWKFTFFCNQWWGFYLFIHATTFDVGYSDCYLIKWRKMKRKREQTNRHELHDIRTEMACGFFRLTFRHTNLQCIRLEIKMLLISLRFFNAEHQIISKDKFHVIFDSFFVLFLLSQLIMTFWLIFQFLFDQQCIFSIFHLSQLISS